MTPTVSPQLIGITKPANANANPDAAQMEPPSTLLPANVSKVAASKWSCAPQDTSGTQLSANASRLVPLHQAPAQVCLPGTILLADVPAKLNRLAMVMPLGSLPPVPADAS